MSKYFATLNKILDFPIGFVNFIINMLSLIMTLLDTYRGLWVGHMILLSILNLESYGIFANVVTFCNETSYE